jgi:glycerol uptake facilitator-like aquaporin
VDALVTEVDGKFISAFVRASKPATRLLFLEILFFMTLRRRIVAECLGTAFLLAAVVGSGIMAEKLASGNMAVALLANTVATGASEFVATFGLLCVIWGCARLAQKRFRWQSAFTQARTGLRLPLLLPIHA